jgi:hypothetical protein
MDSSEVTLYQYDLTQGMARALSLQFLGRQIDGVWHTSIVGKEHAHPQHTAL